MEIEREAIFAILEQVPVFSGLDEIFLDHLSGLFQTEVFHPGKTIFDAGESSDKLYIVYDGQVELKTPSQETGRGFAVLKRGDMFGEEALLYDDLRYYSASPQSKTILLSLNVDHYLYFSEELPEIEEMLDVAIQSRQLALQVNLPWLQPKEHVHVMTRRHPFILWSKLIAPVVFGLAALVFALLLQLQWMPERSVGWVVLGAGLLIMVLWIIWNIIDWRNDYFIVTNKRVVWIEKVALLYESRQEAPLRTIMSVGIEKSQIGRVVGFADVVVMTYVGTIRLRDVAQAETIAKLIESYWRRSETTDQREESQAMAEKLNQKLDLPWLSDSETRAIVNPPLQAEEGNGSREPGFWAWLLSDFIRLRYEQDGAIVYRKHWFVLVEKIWLPTLLMALGLLGIAARLAGNLTFVSMTSAISGLIIFMFLCFVWFVYQYADWRNDIFKVTWDQIVDIDRKPLGKIRQRSAPLENILSIEYQRLGFWGFLFNFGTVYISVGNVRLTFDHVFHPSEVQQDIFYRMGERLEKMRQFEIDSERDRISEWIASYHRKMKQFQQGGGGQP